MKTGDIVTVFDGSYSYAYRNGKLDHSSGVELGNGSFEIIATKCDLPADNSFPASKERNNTVIRRLDDNLLVFIQERFLHLKHTCNICPHCGEKIK